MGFAPVDSWLWLITANRSGASKRSIWNEQTRRWGRGQGKFSSWQFQVGSRQ